MRLVFMGTPEFAATILEALLDQHEVVGVFTRPDAVRGRGKELVPSPVKKLSEAAGIEVFTPSSMKNDEVFETLQGLNPDLICVAAFGRILPKRILELPPLGCLNVHGSLLPRWRGAAPMERSILAGDEYAGVCIMNMEEGLDTGAYCELRSVAIGQKSLDELQAELAKLGAEALLKVLSSLESEGPQSLTWQVQDEDAVTFAPKLAKGELNPDPALGVSDNLRRIQTSNAAHPSRLELGGRTVTILKAQVSEGIPEMKPSSVLFHQGRLLLFCNGGAFEVLILKPDGKKAMDARSFAMGNAAVRDGSACWSKLA